MGYSADQSDLRDLLAIKSGVLADVLEPDQTVTASVYKEATLLVVKLGELVQAYAPYVVPDSEPQPSREEE